MIDRSRSYEQADCLEIHETEDGYAVHNSADGKIHFLNHTAVFLLELCDGQHSIDQVFSIFQEYFKEAQGSQDEVHKLFEEFMSQGLIRPS